MSYGCNFVSFLLPLQNPHMANRSPNPQVRYSLAPGGDAAAFSIDRVSGTVRTTQPLDFEERQVHSLVVRARDRGTPALSSETALVVEVVDVNENRFAPRFDDFVVSAAVSENRPPGTHVTRVKATDADPPGDDSRVSYSIRGGDGVGLFSIDSEGKCSPPLYFRFMKKKSLQVDFSLFIKKNKEHSLEVNPYRL